MSRQRYAAFIFTSRKTSLISIPDRRYCPVSYRGGVASNCAVARRSSIIDIQSSEYHVWLYPLAITGSTIWLNHFSRNLSNDGFDLALKGSLTGTGPLDALITFVEPVKWAHYIARCVNRSINDCFFRSVNWNGQDIATISLPAGQLLVDGLVFDYH